MSIAKENFLIGSITDKSLLNCLDLILKAVNKIWGSDALYIAGDSCNYGIDHSNRMIGFAGHLLKSNVGLPLSEIETWMILAGNYLHDIGMKCDLIKFPQIKFIAECLGAHFDVEFTARSANEYCMHEWEAIRSNHQYLTAAWIKFAKQSGETILGTVVQAIPEVLLPDLMDICKYHSDLPISDCPSAFKFNSTHRKQLIVALLRFCDELDRDVTESQINIIKDNNFEQPNSVDWWLRNRTHVVIGENNRITLEILLHPDDKEKCGNFLYDYFINEFQTRNQPIISILRKNNIPVIIDATSDVVGNYGIDKLPENIKEKIILIQQRGPLYKLAEEVRNWLRAIRYEVSEPQLIDDRSIEMIAAFSQGPLKQRVLIRCFEGIIRPEDIETFKNILDFRLSQGWLITEKQVPNQLYDISNEIDSIYVFSLSEFLRQQIWGSYFDNITSLVENANINKYYIDISCYEQTIGDRDDRYLDEIHYKSLDIYIDNWLQEQNKMHISLLGQFGSGKTWFCRHYAYRQLERYLKNPINQRVPLLITLRDFTKAMTAEQLINDAFLEQYKMAFVGSPYEIFQEMNRRGKLLLILDGFDEMARQVDYQTVVDNFWELSKLVNRNSKVLLTCRTEYFRWAKESEKVLGGREFGRSTIILSPPNFEVLYLKALNDDQIRHAISLRIGRENKFNVVERIMNNNNLVEIARKPVLIEFLLAAINEVSPDILENPAQVYLYSTNRLLLRNIDTKRTFTSTSDKLYFLCELAWDMIQNNEMQIHYANIPNQVLYYFGDKIKGKNDLDNWDFDLRAQTLLHRNVNGFYSFAHKSLMEYFVALKLSSELGCLAPAFSETYREADGNPSGIPFAKKDMAGLASSFGKISLRRFDMDTVRLLMIGMMSEDAPMRLWRLIDEASAKSPEEVGFCAANAATLLEKMGLWHPYKSEEISDLLEDMQKQPINVMLSAVPPLLRKMERMLQEVGVSITSIEDQIKDPNLGVGYKEAILAYKSAKSGHLEDASDFAWKSAEKNKDLRYFCLSVQAYCALRYMYLNNLNEAERSFDKYLKMGGNPLWYHLKMGYVYLLKGNIFAAREEANNVFEIAQPLDCEDDKTLNFLGIAGQDIDACNKAISILKGRAEILLAIIDRIDQKYYESTIAFKNALDIFGYENDLYHEALALANIGVNYRMMGEYAKAAEIFTKALNHFSDLRDPYRMACIHARRGSVFRLLRDYSRAIEDYAEAIKIFSDLGEKPQIGAVFRELGTTYLMLGKWDESIDSYDQALQIFLSPDMSHKPESYLRAGLLFHNIGLALLMQGRWELAISRFKEGLVIFRNTGDLYNVSLTLSSLGSAYRMIDQYEEARECLLEAIEIVETMKDTRRQTLLLMKLGSAYRQLHNYQEALRCYEKALKMVLDLKNSVFKEDEMRRDLLFTQGKILIEIGTIYRSINKIEDAISYYFQALDIFTNASNTDLAKVSRILEELGEVYAIQGLFSKAIVEYKKVIIALSQQRGGLIDDESLVDIPESYIIREMFDGNIQTIRADLDDIERLGNIALHAKTLRNLGEAYRKQGEFNEALIYLKESREIFRSIRDRDQEGRTLCNLGLAYANISYSIFNDPDKSNSELLFKYYLESIYSIKRAIGIFAEIGDYFLQGRALEILGFIYLCQEMWDNAVDALKETIELGYKSGLVHLSLAICYKNLLKLEQSKSQCRIAHELINIEGITDYDIARLEANCGNKNKSIELIISALNKGQINRNVIIRDPYMRILSDHPKLLEILKESSKLKSIPATKGERRSGFDGDREAQ